MAKGIYSKGKNGLVNGVQYLLIGDEVFKSVPFGQWEDGDIEADCINDTLRVLVSKNDTGYFVANAVDGYGINRREQFKNSTVIILSAASTPPQEVEAEGQQEFEELAIDAMDFQWRHCIKELERKDLGDIEKRSYEKLRDRLHYIITKK